MFLASLLMAASPAFGGASLSGAIAPEPNLRSTTLGGHKIAEEFADGRI
jgi:hypothetical protein